MSWLRSPYLFLVMSLGLAAFFFIAYLEWWRGLPRSSAWSLGDVLLMATLSSTFSWLVALVTALTALRRPRQPLPTVVAVFCVVALVLGVLWGLGVAVSMG
jgi:hypothetical protein